MNCYQYLSLSTLNQNPSTIRLLGSLKTAIRRTSSSSLFRTRYLNQTVSYTLNRSPSLSIKYVITASTLEVDSTSLTTNFASFLLRQPIIQLRLTTLERIASTSICPTTSSSLNLVLIQLNSYITTIVVSIIRQLDNGTKEH